MGRPREFDGTDVVDAALETFWVRGFAGTSTEQLCERTGLGRGSLYNAYGSKRGLYLRVLLRYFEVGIASQEAILRAPGSARERLRALLLRSVETDLADPARRGCLAINAAHELAAGDPDVRAQVAKHFARIEDLIHETVLAGQRSGEFRAGRDARVVARTVMSAHYGLRTLATVTDDRDRLVAVVEDTVSAL